LANAKTTPTSIKAASVKHEQTWDVLDHALDSIKYERDQHPSGQRFNLVRKDEDNIARLYIFSYNVDTFNPPEMRFTRHEFMVPVATYNFDTWVRWVFDCIMKMEAHETTEWFNVDGKRIFGPHHGNGEDRYSFWPGHDVKKKFKHPGQD
jgi:hypothetical protein